MPFFYTFLADWVAVGFSDRGELTDADFCVFWVDWKGGAQVQVSTSTLFLGILIATRSAAYVILLFKPRLCRTD